MEFSLEEMDALGDYLDTLLLTDPKNRNLQELIVAYADLLLYYVEHEILMVDA